MAINPHTDFVAGAILTASQQNRFPRGIMTVAENVTTSGTITAEAVQVTAPAFTAVANRYYLIQYVEQDLFRSAATAIQMRIRLTNLAGAIQTFSQDITGTANINNMMTTSRVMTFAAGSVVLVGTLQCSGAGTISTRGTTSPAYILVTDLGPA
jgi:hypothetical protein